MNSTIHLAAWVSCLLLCLGAIASTGLAAEATGAGEKRLDGIKSTPSWVTRLGSIHCCARHIGIDEPSAWIFGTSGSAFAMNIFKGELCPSGPTAWPEEKSNAQCWAECRRNATKFLELANKRLEGTEVRLCLTKAILCYSRVWRQLDVVAKLFPFDHRDRKGMNANWADKTRREKAARALRAARKAEREGLTALAELAKTLGADVDPKKLNLPE